MSVGTLTLNRFEGQEIFNIAEAIIYRLPDDDSVDLNFDINCDSAQKVLPGNEASGIRPSAEFNATTASHTWDEFVGKRYEIPEGDTEEDLVASLYYHEHEPVDGITIEVKEKDGDRFRVVIKGNTCDPRYYDDSKPRTELVIDAWFHPASG